MNYERLMDIIKRRRSVRSFLQEYPITDEQISQLLESAKHVPSARNIQPLEFIVVRDKEILKAMCEPCQQSQTSMVNATIVIVGDVVLARKVGQLSSHSATSGEKGDTIFIYMDAAAATQNICLAATAMGLDTLWISSFHEKLLANILKLPETYRPLVVIPIGKRKHEPFSPPKRSIKERTHFDTFKRINHDFSYLDVSKLINEAEGELKNYLDVNWMNAEALLNEVLSNSSLVQDKEAFKKKAKAVSKKCFLISKLIKKRQFGFLNEEEMRVMGLLHDIGRCLTANETEFELKTMELLSSKGFGRMAAIIGSQVIGLEKIRRYWKNRVKIISDLSIDSIEKEILTFAILTTDWKGKDIPYEENIALFISHAQDPSLKTMIQDKASFLKSLCEKMEHKINQ